MSEDATFVALLHAHIIANADYQSHVPAYKTIGASAYIRNADHHNNGSSTITTVEYCNVGDKVGVSLEAETSYAHPDQWQRVSTPATHCKN